MVLIPRVDVQRLVVGAVAGACVATVVAGCSSAQDPTAVSSTSRAVSPAPADASASSAAVSSASPQLPPSPSVTAAPGSIGTVQEVTTDDVRARITVQNSPTVIDQPSIQSRTVVFPVSVEVESGSLRVDPSRWKLITLSGQKIDGLPSSNLSTALGDSTVDRRAEGLLPFRATSTELGDDVSIARIEFYSGDHLWDSNGEPIARWDAPEPITIGSLPRRDR